MANLPHMSQSNVVVPGFCVTRLQLPPHSGGHTGQGIELFMVESARVMHSKLVLEKPRRAKYGLGNRLRQ
jgi:hypothetical protein